MQTVTEALSPADLTAIRSLTNKEFAESDLYTFSVKCITDEPTANGRIWSREWQAANVAKFVGIPVLVNHENDQNVALGRVYHAEIRENAIHAKVYIPTNTQVGEDAKRLIEAGLFKSVSISASGKTVREGDLSRMMPGEDDRVFELSFVAVPGCRDCGVTANECCQEKGEPRGADEGSIITGELREYAQHLKESLSAEFVRAAGFAVGEGFRREAYRSIADRLGPDCLKTLTEDYRRIVQSRTGRTEAVSASCGVAETLQAIRNAKND